MKIKFMIIIQLFVSLLFLVTNVLAACNVYTGPEGDIDCRSFTWIGTASGSQWARCMSKERLRNITNGSLTCIFSYCNYLCMQEFYDLKAGEIYSDCQCTNEQLLNVDKSRPDINDLCYKPNTTDCSWYDNCFAKRYPKCTETTINAQTSNMLVVEFGKKFCNIVEQNRNYLSDFARQWSEQAHKCLIDKMAMLIRPWQNEVCENMESEIMNYLSPCFVKPDLTQTTSVCQLDCKSWWLLLRDMKNFFSMGNSKWSRILQQFAKFGVKGCDEDGFFTRCWSDSATLDNFKKNFLFYRIKLLSKVSKVDINDLAFQVSKKLLSDLNIDSNVIDWYVNIDESSPDRYVLSLIYSKGLEQLDFSTDTGSSQVETTSKPKSSKKVIDSSVRMNRVASNMKSMENRLPYDVVPLTSISIIDTCNDPLCNEVTATWANKASPGSKSGNRDGGVPVSSSSCHLIFNFFFFSCLCLFSSFRIF